MKKFLLSLFLSSLLAAQPLYAQTVSQVLSTRVRAMSSNLAAEKPHLKRYCGTMDGLEYQLKQNPSLKQKMIEDEVETQKQIQLLESNPNKTATVKKIAVVVHVVYNTPTQNISDAQIFSQLVVLNKDFRKQNSDVNQIPPSFAPLAADAEIEFCLANVDPNGNATSGITRTQTSNAGGFYNPTPNVKSDATGGKSPWNTTKYLNIWVCYLNQGLLGYAQFPSGATASNDGVVIDYKAFGTIGTAATGSFNLGRTAVHEIGHYLNLRHIWGDANCGNDFVNDTPTQQQEHYNCPIFPQVTCSNGPDGDMFMNYMDYVDDRCMFMFTADQKTRMLATLNGSRATLLTNSNISCNTAACDTLANYTPGVNQLAIYRPQEVGWPGTGYISGTNSYMDEGFAEKFGTLQPQQKLYGAMIRFGAVSGTTSSMATVKVWKADGSSPANGIAGAPLTVLASQTISFTQIVSDMNANKYSTITFNTPITYNTGFYYIGIEVDPASSDTIALATTVNNDVTTGKSYEKISTHKWFPFTDAQQSWGVEVALAIRPIVCLDFTGISESNTISDAVLLFPNPSNGTFTVKSEVFENERVQLKVYNSVGAVVVNESKMPVSSNQFNIDLSQQTRGLYVVEIKTSEHTIIKKVNLIH